MGPRDAVRSGVQAGFGGVGSVHHEEGWHQRMRRPFHPVPGARCSASNRKLNRGQGVAVGSQWRMIVRQCAIPRLDAELSQSVAALVGQEVLIAVPVDVARADQRLELFWRQLLAGGLPLQFSNDLVHAASIMNALGIAVTVRPLSLANTRRVKSLP